MLNCFARVIWPKKADKQATSLPDIGFELTAMSAKQRYVRVYEKLCGFDVSDNFSATYIHTLLFPLMMKVMLDKSFPYRIKVDFKLPIFLPSTVAYYQEQQGDQTVFEVRSANARKSHLRGELTEL